MKNTFESLINHSFELLLNEFESDDMDIDEKKVIANAFVSNIVENLGNISKIGDSLQVIKSASLVYDDNWISEMLSKKNLSDDEYEKVLNKCIEAKNLLLEFKREKWNKPALSNQNYDVVIKKTNELFQKKRKDNEIHQRILDIDLEIDRIDTNIDMLTENNCDYIFTLCEEQEENLKAYALKPNEYSQIKHMQIPKVRTKYQNYKEMLILDNGLPSEQEIIADKSKRALYLNKLKKSEMCLNFCNDNSYLIPSLKHNDIKRLLSELNDEEKSELHISLNDTIIDDHNLDEHINGVQLKEKKCNENIKKRYPLDKTGKIFLIAGTTSVIGEIVLVFLLLAWYFWFVIGALILVSCIANINGGAFALNISRGITNLVLGAAISILLYLLVIYLVLCIYKLAMPIIVFMSLGVFIISYIISYLIGKKAF